MKAGSAIAAAMLVAVAACSGDGRERDAGAHDAGVSDAGARDAGPSEPRLAQGFLQFEVVHNLDEPICIEQNQCSLRIERTTDIEAWLDTIADRSSLAVLHWDRAVPWAAFSEPAPDAADAIAFYDARLDVDYRAYVDAFAAHFATLRPGFLAVSLLHGERNRLENLRVRPDLEVDFGATCAPLSPTYRVDTTYRDGASDVPLRFDLRETYLRFLRYLYAKLSPRYFAILVEANLFYELCPAEWAGLVELYRDLYDTLRPEIAPDTALFATITLQHLLAYDFDSCWGEFQSVPCATPDAPVTFPTPTAERCYPIDRTPLDDLDAGGRLEVLALSFYPDSLRQQPPSAPPLALELHPDPWDGTSTCSVRAPYPPYFDPYDQIERLGWTKPIVFAETSARHCGSLVRFDEPTFTGYVRAGANEASQQFWLEQTLAAARDYDARFVAWSFFKDYPPIEAAFYEKNAIPSELLNLFNIWACSGLYTTEGEANVPATAIWEAALSED